MYRYHRRSRYTSERGSICGIDPKDLPENLLQNIATEKLIECVDADSRIEGVLANKIVDFKFDDLVRLKNLPEGSYPAVKQAYNNYLDVNWQKLISHLESSYYNTRHNYIISKLINDDRRLVELRRLLEGKQSIYTKSNVDYGRCFNHFDSLTTDSVTKTIENANSKYAGCSASEQIAKTLPKHKIKEFFPKLAKTKPIVAMHMVANPNCPEEYAVKALKAMGKKTPPDIKIDITYNILDQLPPIGRLNVMENLINNRHMDRIKLENEEQVSNLLFSSVIRYPERVQKVVNFAKRYFDRNRGATL